MPTTSPPDARPLAVCIDDLGLHAGVNAAAFDLYARGRVSSWSCLVDGPAMPGLRAWLDASPHDTLELGLHLNLTEALPGAGWVRPLNGLLLAAYRGALQAERAALADEIARQCDAFEQRLGRAPDFVDGHQHVHQLPVVRELLLAELARRWPAGTRRPWLRRCAAPAVAPRPAPPLPGPERVKPWLIDTLGRRGLDALAQRGGWRQNAHLLGVRRFMADDAGFTALLDVWLARAADADLLMVHPAAPMDGVADGLRDARACEHRVLAGDAFGALLARHGLRVQALRDTLTTGRESSTAP